jgi:hypothetical protein
MKEYVDRPMRLGEYSLGSGSGRERGGFEQSMSIFYLLGSRCWDGEESEFRETEEAECTYPCRRAVLIKLDRSPPPQYYMSKCQNLFSSNFNERSMPPSRYTISHFLGRCTVKCEEV